MSLQSRTKYRKQCLGWEGLPTYPPTTTRENLSVFDKERNTHKIYLTKYSYLNIIPQLLTP